MWSDGVCCIDWLSCAYAQLFIILTSRAAWATVFRIFLFHFCYTSGYPGCGARDSWCMFIIRLLFSNSDLCLNTFQQKKLPLSAVFHLPCHVYFLGSISAQQCPWNKLLIMIFPSLPQTVEHGFPHQPSALGYSPFLRLMAIGTRSGAIKLYPLNTLGESSLTSTECGALKTLPQSDQVWICRQGLQEHWNSLPGFGVILVWSGWDYLSKSWAIAPTEAELMQILNKTLLLLCRRSD